jgi:hypothetical protein
MFLKYLICCDIVKYHKFNKIQKQKISNIVENNLFDIKLQ